MSTLRKGFSVRYDGDRNQTYVMKFIVADLKLLNKMVQNANSDEEILLSDSLQEKQPGFYEEIEDVRMDPRCLDACRFCTLFCSLALDCAERVTGECLPSFPKSVFHEWLKLEPDWGWGWIGWSDCYWLWEYLGLEKDLDKAEEILRKGLSVSNVSDRDHIEDRLEDLLKEKNKI